MNNGNPQEAARDVPPLDRDPESRWAEPLPAVVPRPTYWPAILALGTFLLLLGFVTNWIISGAGLILTYLALRGWIGEFRHEHRQQESNGE